MADWTVFRGLNPQGVERKGYPGLQPLGILGGHEKPFGNWELVWLIGTEVLVPGSLQALGPDCGSGLGC